MFGSRGDHTEHLFYASSLAAEVFRVDLRNPDGLADLLNQFYDHTERDYEGFEEAVAEFRERIPNLAKGLLAKIAAAQTSVIRALRHSGGLNAGTPSDIASTPVNAAAPELKARRMRKMVSAPLPPDADSQSAGGTYAGNVPVAQRPTPIAIIARMATMYR